MPAIDLFCRVVDNYGDIGVCWRLARQLVAEHGCKVRLIVDDLKAFRCIAPEIDPALTQQNLLGVDVVAWPVSDVLQPAEIVIEAFACDPPASYVLAMAALAEKPAWINLEYLSAEAWVDGVHSLPSPHPGLPLTKYFFCPGFTEKSGGLIRECVFASHSSLSRSAAEGWGEGSCVINSVTMGESSNPLVQGPPAKKVIASVRIGENADRPHPPPSPALRERGLKLLAFAYTHAPVRAFATALNAQVTTASRFDETDPAWRSAPPVPQTEFDALLAQFDVLIVRGEDSFVRAQYAAKPFLWHIYPTPDNAHFVKLDAWLDRYCEGLATDAASAFRQAQQAFNRGDTNTEAYADFAANLPALTGHAALWRDHLFAQTDLSTRLLKFADSLKKRKVG